MTWMQWFTEPYELISLKRALAICLLAGFSNGFMSGFVVLKRSALLVGSLSHTLLPGIALAALWFGLSYTSALVGALVASLAVGLGSLLISRSSRIDQDSAMAVLYTMAFAAGLIILRFSPTNVNLEHFLFGNILFVSDGDLWAVLGLGCLVLVTVSLLERPILLTLFEPSMAATQGVPVRLLQYVLQGLLILVMISSIQAVGCFLALGMLVAPGAIVYLFTDSTRVLFWAGGILGALTCSLALTASHWLEIPPGSAITVLLGLLFLVAYLISPKYGLIGKLRGRELT